MVPPHLASIASGCRPALLPSRPALEFSPEETDYIDSQAEASEDDSEMEVEIPSPWPRARARPRVCARATPAPASGKPIPCLHPWCYGLGVVQIPAPAAAGKLGLMRGPWIWVGRFRSCHRLMTMKLYHLVASWGLGCGLCALALPRSSGQAAPGPAAGESSLVCGLQDLHQLPVIRCTWLVWSLASGIELEGQLPHAVPGEHTLPA